MELTEDLGRYASNGAYAREFDPCIASVNGRAVVRDEIRMGWDGGDPWGSCLSNLGGICDVLWTLGGDIPASAGYSPGAGGPALDDYPAAMFAELFADGWASVPDFEYWARALNLFADLIPEDHKY